MTWLPVTNYEYEYLVSDTGVVYSLRSKKPLKQFANDSGYLRVCLQRAGVKKWKRVHRLVAEAFLKNPDSKPTVNHKNGDRQDNSVGNLEWATMKEQNSTMLRRTRMSEAMRCSEYSMKRKKPVYQMSLDGTVIEKHSGLNDAARAVNTSAGNIYGCCVHKRKTCKGYRFEYALEEGKDETV